MTRNTLVALLLAPLLVGSGTLLLGQTEFHRPLNDDPAGFTADPPADRNEPIQAPTPIAPPDNSKGRNRQPVLEVGVPANVDLLNFVVYPVGSDEPVAETYTNDPSWPVEPLQGDLLPVGEYVWTCRALFNAGWSDFFMPFWRFEVEKTDPDNPLDDIGKRTELPPSPTPVSPRHRSKGRNGDITLVVTGGLDYDEFHFRVDGGNSGHGVWEGYTSRPEWRVPRFPVYVYGTFNWTCRARLGGLWSNWFAPEWTFEIENPTTQPNGDMTSAIYPVSSVAVTPNPARSGTELRFLLARDCHVTAVLYDAQGASVRTLAAGRLAAGSHGLSWNGRDDIGRRVGAGTYLCRITADGASSVVRITISR